MSKYKENKILTWALYRLNSCADEDSLERAYYTFKLFIGELLMYMSVCLRVHRFRLRTQFVEQSSHDKLKRSASLKARRMLINREDLPLDTLMPFYVCPDCGNTNYLIATLPMDCVIHPPGCSLNSINNYNHTPQPLLNKGAWDLSTSTLDTNKITNMLCENCGFHAKPEFFDPNGTSSHAIARELRKVAAKRRKLAEQE